MKAWLAIAGLLLFLSLPAILTMIPTSPKAVPARVPSTAADDTSSSPRHLLTADDKEAVFMQMWSTVDEFYMYFDRRDVDWDAVRDQYLPVARSTRDDDEFHRILRTAIAELGDGHMIIQSTGSDWARPRIYVMPDGEQIVIAQVGPGSDAEAAGLRAGMSLLEVDGLPVREAWARMTEVIAASTLKVPVTWEDLL